MNCPKTKVPRVYIAATRQNNGKTTASVGLTSLLRTRFDRVGFIKPVGQHYVKIDGKKIDDDAVLLSVGTGCNGNLDDMNPVLVDRRFTRNYIENPNPQVYEKRIRESFERISQNKDIVVIEGTGHAGVGSIFGYNNARVAKLLHSPAILIAGGGIGKPFDEIILNQALFEKHGVDLAGVVINKVLPEKLEEIEHYMSRALKHIGLNLLAVIPHEQQLLNPTINHILDGLDDAELINGENNLSNSVEEIIIGAMSPQQALRFFVNGTLMVTPGDRGDLILTAISLASTSREQDEQVIAGIVLTGEIPIREEVLNVIKRTEIPVIVCHKNAYSIASRLHGMMVKVRPDETKKIQSIQQMYKKYFDVEKLLEYL